ncbi:MAG: hypothetical protein UU54_C0013G0013 [Candidatus Yanofskybacteria bacterium GW2011_GWA2_41_22]|uniref:Uncharacterized protein n=3 Tax=Candidatus Yanofskyibacteriota TaxID=1752733 RepID=A0A1F8HTL6_9BACT|nr:MAG: hypothetical protein UU54_C0013G0013 [Candidatus Yanofskybacteria bacterium GW2011_GWA2_41_22]OGM99351.1 MAG: hypothetical protein A2736_00550 [Candidatus Yanofskybacteria bacterium RIFCSPHIGHO2_01_FULL_41_27]OGN09881.1 MAG: hypothetical protein A3C64_00670 [Candidatus Yanofskybacteria bacterium RIFCSPHIGHO2_02_FULL_41_12]OGN20490.1 MAG: hypothetical protein A3B00_00010 [Candidatus Yanofskybacteria bacterium RIFCSPLOWO2_01_FULL_41_33]OGN40921.1 MAG: hypothetical protein A2606_02005 [Can
MNAVVTNLNIKRQNGRYYTQGNPFQLDPFKLWAEKIKLRNHKVLEPYAGANNIIRTLQAVGYAKNFTSFDIEPDSPDVEYRDTISNFPNNFKTCITNPPWLAKNSAHRRGLWYPNTKFDDLYKHALHLCLENCENVGALIPATFLQSRLFLERLDSIIFLHDKGMFSDTENPVCLALFTKKSEDVHIFFDSTFIGSLSDLSKNLPTGNKKAEELVFNDPQGELGFIAFDDTQGPSIRFCRGAELSNYNICHSSRMITRIGGNFSNLSSLVYNLNNELSEFRNSTKDVFLTPFKGLRKDGMYRRRMDYQLARNFISTHA